MNTLNITSIIPGMAGTFAGTRYRVAGRVVMKMVEDGTTYYWDEFNLVSDSGNTATLVWEAGDDGGQWRMFTLFEPARPLTAAEAAAKRAGDFFRLDGTPLRVTLVDESAVHAIEGQAPEGVELGDVARYFNAESDRQMVVVSWTGEEVEHYRGMNLSHEAVSTAFGVQLRQPQLVSATGLSTRVKRGAGLWVALPSLLLLSLTPLLLNRASRPTEPVVRKVAAAAAPFASGTRGSLDGTTYDVVGHAVMEIAEVNRLFDRHEYEIRDTEGRVSLLVCGLKPGDRRWALFTPHDAEPVLTPFEAGAKRVGDLLAPFELARVTRLFRSMALPTGNAGPEPAHTSGTRYGLVAEAADGLWMARWNERELVLYRGKPLAAGAFAPQSGSTLRR